MKERSRRVLAACLLLTGAVACDTIEDKVSCTNNRVDLVNSDQSPSAVSILGPGESDTPDKLLAVGATRRITVCFMKGDQEKFRALHSGVEVGLVNCVALQSTYEASVPQVLWTPVGFLCQGW